MKRAVKRNLNRFPSDFMFQLNSEEAKILRCQFGTSSSEEKQRSRCQFGTLKRGQNVKYLPYVFTEQGVAMLSSVLNSERAIQVNIMIMRTFTRLRRMTFLYKDLREKIENMEAKYDQKFKIVFVALKELLEKPEKSKRGIGFHAQ